MYVVCFMSMFQTKESSDEDANVMKTDQADMVIEVMKECESDSTETGRVICETTDGVKDVFPHNLQVILENYVIVY